MSLTKLTKDLNIIATLDDEPNDVGGLSAADAKAKFDEAGNAVKSFLNESLIPEMEAQMATKEEVQGLTLGQIPDDTITQAKLSSALQGEIGKIGGLQEQIDEKVDLSSKASEAEAIAGTDNTKFMTPAKTKSSIGTAAQTVFDVSQSSYVKLKTDIESYPIGSFGLCSAQNANGYTGSFYFDQDAYVVYKIPGYVVVASSYQVVNTSNSVLNYALRIVVVETNTWTMTWDSGWGQSLGSSAVSLSLERIYSGTDKVIRIGNYMVDIEKKIMTNVGSNSIAGMFATNTYWGYVYSNGSDKYVYCAPRGSTSFTSYAITSGGYTSGTAIIGIYNEILYFYQVGSSYTNSLCKFDLTTKACTIGLETWVCRPSYYPLTINSSIAIIQVADTAGSTYSLLVLDMATGTSNYNSLTFESNSLFQYINGSCYIGSSEQYAYFYYAGLKTIMLVDKTLKRLDSWYAVYGDPYVGGAQYKYTKEAIFTDGYIRVGRWLFNTARGIFIPIKSPDYVYMSTSYVSAPLVCASVPRGLVLYGPGVHEDTKLMGLISTTVSGGTTHIAAVLQGSPNRCLIGTTSA